MVDKDTRPTRPSRPDEQAAESSARRRLSTSVRGVHKGSVWVRNRVAAVVWLLAALGAAVLAIGALLVAFEANDQNVVYQWFTDAARTLAGPLDSLFQLDDAAEEVLVNWGIAAAAYLVVGRLVQGIIKA